MVVGFLPELMLSVSISVSRRSTVERSMVSMVSVMVDVIVWTTSVPGPESVVEISTVRSVVLVDVTTTTSHTS